MNRIGYKRDKKSGDWVNMEKVYSVLDILSSGMWFESSNEFLDYCGEEFRGITPEGALRSFILDTLEKPSMEALEHGCKFHDELSRILEKGDVIVSFNYDTIVDSSLKKNRTWREHDGYGFMCREIKNNSGKDRETDQTSDYESQVHLLKPHGSINWGIKELSTVSTKGYSDIDITQIPINTYDEISKQEGSKSYISVKEIDNTSSSCTYGHILMRDYEEIKKLPNRERGQISSFRVF